VPIHDVNRPNQERRAARTIAPTYLISGLGPVIRKEVRSTLATSFGTEGSYPVPNISCFCHASTRTGPQTGCPSLVHCYSSISVPW
jgi:hypothetical protein